jgi:integrase/recombinase XerC
MKSNMDQIGIVIPETTNILPEVLTTEIHIIGQWLRARASRSQHTAEAYHGQAQKFINWAYTQNLSIAELSIEDASDYLEYLKSMSLKNSSVKYARTILKQMFEYICDYGYLHRNVFKLTAIPEVIDETEPDKFLDIDAWIWLWQWLTNRPAKSNSQAKFNARNRWLFALIYHTGLRRTEVANGKMCDFVFKSGRWALKVIGKRNKIRFVSVNSILLQELKIYRTFLQLPPLPVLNEDYGLVIPLKGNNTNLTFRAIGLVVHTVREMALLECDDEHIFIQIKNMSTHWMRHTNTTHRFIAGASLETIQDEQGHADPKTTRIYLHALPWQRQEDAEKLANLNIIENKKIGI